MSAMLGKARALFSVDLPLANHFVSLQLNGSSETCKNIFGQNGHYTLHSTQWWSKSMSAAYFSNFFNRFGKMFVLACCKIYRSVGSTPPCLDLTDRWLNKLSVRRLEPTKESHSRMLSDKGIVYELQTHNIKPDSVDDYLKNFKQNVELISAKKELKIELVGSWTVMVGDMDQALHLWKYTGGYSEVDNVTRTLPLDKDYLRLQKERGLFLRARHLQYLLKFSYWPALQSRTGNNLYEIRSYSLKPGTMIEWGNNWARGINFRRNSDEAFAGFFSQIGRLYNVHHIWCYKDFQSRTDTRDNAWRSPGWDECVAYTVPLIREMQSRILEPTEFSPTK